MHLIKEKSISEQHNGKMCVFFKTCLTLSLRSKKVLGLNLPALHALHVTVWVFLGYSGFLQHPKDMQEGQLATLNYP